MNRGLLLALLFGCACDICLPHGASARQLSGLPRGKGSYKSAQGGEAACESTSLTFPDHSFLFLLPWDLTQLSWGVREIMGMKSFINYKRSFIHSFIQQTYVGGPLFAREPGIQGSMKQL